MMIDAIEITLKMYSSRNSMRNLYKDEYSEKIRWYKDTINYIMSKEKLGNYLEAVILACNMDSVKDNGLVVALFLSAGLELSESEE